MIVVAARAGSVDGLRLVRLVVEEVEVGSLLMQRNVGNGNTNHRASEFASKQRHRKSKKAFACDDR